ncbi:hypothetical protein L7F22_062685 [Adiantum nelumboides]|nr:hypothetical protein [Adiantum nelumboides]
MVAPIEIRYEATGRRILFEKTLFGSDIENRQNRLMLGNEHKAALLIERLGNPKVKKDILINLVDELDKEVINLTFGHWASSSAFIIKGGWCKYGSKHGIKEGDMVTLSEDGEGKLYINHTSVARHVPQSTLPNDAKF